MPQTLGEIVENRGRFTREWLLDSGATRVILGAVPQCFQLNNSWHPVEDWSVTQSQGIWSGTTDTFSWSLAGNNLTIDSRFGSASLTIAELLGDSTRLQRFLSNITWSQDADGLYHDFLSGAIQLRLDADPNKLSLSVVIKENPFAGKPNVPNAIWLRLPKLGSSLPWTKSAHKGVLDLTSSILWQEDSMEIMKGIDITNPYILADLTNPLVLDPTLDDTSSVAGYVRVNYADSSYTKVFPDTQLLCGSYSTGKLGTYVGKAFWRYDLSSYAGTISNAALSWAWYAVINDTDTLAQVAAYDTGQSGLTIWNTAVESTLSTTITTADTGFSSSTLTSGCQTKQGGTISFAMWPPAPVYGASGGISTTGLQLSFDYTPASHPLRVRNLAVRANNNLQLRARQI
jgi:hypothetical protein